MIGPTQFNNSTQPSLIALSGRRPLDMLLVGDEWYGTAPAVDRGLPAGADAAKSPLRVFEIGCEVKSWNNETDKPVSVKFGAIFDPRTDDTLAKAAPGFDELRRLGQLDLELNHPEVWEREKR
jgi:hypothetical protein